MLTALAVLIVPLAGCQAPATSAPPPPPNIILIMADDLGYAELGCYGQEKIRTPHVDRLAAGGMRFTQFYTASPVCAPARCSLLTGKHGGHAFIRDNSEVGSWESFRGQLPLPAAEVTIAEALEQRGYAAGAFGKWGLGEVGSSGDPLAQGFDRFYGYNCQRHAHNYYPRYLIDDRAQVTLEGNDHGQTGAQYAPQLIADEALEFIRAHRDEPFFLYYATIIPHLALQVPDEELAQYDGQWDDPPYEGGKGYLPHTRPRAAYAAMVSFLDKQVGRIVETLEELGLAERTIILFTSDNGPTYDRIGGSDSAFFESNRPFSGLKGSVREGGIRVPLVVRWPGKIAPGQVSDHIGATYDLLATLCDLAGTDMPSGGDGISFAPMLLGRAGEQRQHEYLFWDFPGYGGQLAVRMGRWKGMKTGLKKDPEAPPQLFDLEADPAESRDVAAEHPDVAARIERIMLEARDEPSTEAFRFGKYR